MNSFFDDSSEFDRHVLRPLSHITPSWELIWDPNTTQYKEDSDGLGAVVNSILSEVAMAQVPANYHNNEDALAEYAKNALGWPIKKVGGRWQGADYASILEQGGFSDVNQTELVGAVAGRIAAARHFGQEHYDDMDPAHQAMLAAVVSIIVYHRINKT
jgi:hypothetical protein